MHARSIALTATLLVLAGAGAACSSTTAPFSPSYNPTIPQSWAVSVTNPYFPLVVGTTWQYRGNTSQGLETITIEVLPGTRMVNGVSATVVRDRVFLNGALIEDTFDWYVQDLTGNVWYLGEDSKEIVNGVAVSTEGSWEWGKDGALPGIVMWSDPASKLGMEYRQEFYKGVAEDWGKVIAVGQAVVVPFGSFSNCITTEDWIGLEPNKPRENKVYCPQVGFVRETTPGSSEKVELISRTP